MPSPNKLRITWVRSAIGCPVRQRATVRALGLRRLHHTVFHTDTPAIRGMLHAVRHLVQVAEATEAEVTAAAQPKLRAPQPIVLRTAAEVGWEPKPARAAAKKEAPAPAPIGPERPGGRHHTATAPAQIEATSAGALSPEPEAIEPEAAAPKAEPEAAGKAEPEAAAPKVEPEAAAPKATRTRKAATAKESHGETGAPAEKPRRASRAKPKASTEDKV